MHHLATTTTTTTTAALISAPAITAILVGIVIPFLVDFVTNHEANPKLKAGIASALSILAGALGTVAYNPNAGWKQYVFNVALAFFATFTTHATGATDSVQRHSASIGIGGPRSRYHRKRATAPTTKTTLN